MTLLDSRLQFALPLAMVAAFAAAPTHAQVAVTVLGSAPNNSVAYAAAGGQQAGFDGLAPVIWSGSAVGAVSLLPTGALAAHVRATDGAQQGGFANFVNANGTEHAARWTGTAASFVDLHPAGASWSRVFAVAAVSALADGVDINL